MNLSYITLIIKLLIQVNNINVPYLFGRNDIKSLYTLLEYGLYIYKHRLLYNYCIKLRYIISFITLNNLLTKLKYVYGNILLVCILFRNKVVYINIATY